ncbi:hypothetical protein [Azospirillum sp.]|uniref:hypothetical protein n=1 Tax=Azospirillum sp. TaxID=34012 RepID=UPI00260A1BCE|nr:hypothetical protein [Azospirillum sp.]
MADSENTTTLPVSRRHLLVGVGVAVLSVAATSGAATGDDAELLNLIHQLHDAVNVCDRVWGDYNDLFEHGLSLRAWTTEELKRHRIPLGDGRSRTPTLEDLERYDGWDDPTHRKVSREEKEEGDVWSMTITTHQPTPTGDEVAAWRERCAARRALYDAKQTAANELGCDAVLEKADALRGEVNRLCALVEGTAPVTLAGAVAKLKACNTVCPDEVIEESTLFAAALADLERLAGGAA